jgi:hypothetical protein
MPRTPEQVLDAAALCERAGLPPWMVGPLSDILSKEMERIGSEVQNQVLAYSDSNSIFVSWLFPDNWCSYLATQPAGGDVG